MEIIRSLLPKQNRYCIVGGILIAGFVFLSFFGALRYSCPAVGTLLSGLGVAATVGALYVALFKESIIREIDPIKVTLELPEMNLITTPFKDNGKTSHYFHIRIDNKKKHQYVRNPRLFLIGVSQPGDGSAPINPLPPLLLKQAQSKEQDISSGFQKGAYFDLGQLDIPKNGSGAHKFHLQVGSDEKLRKNAPYTVEKEKTKRVRLRFEADNLTAPCEQEFTIFVDSDDESKIGRTGRELVEIKKVANENGPE